MKMLVRTGLITSLLLGLPTLAEARDGHAAYLKMQKQWAEARAGMPDYEKPTWMMALFGLEAADKTVAQGKNTTDAAKTKRPGPAE